jgi:hypothetical protein
MSETSPSTTLAAPALPRREPYGTLAGSAIILLVALFFAYGLKFINSRIPGVETVIAGTRIKIGRGVSYTTVRGWSLELARTKPDDTSALLRDASSFAITTFDWTGTEAELVTRAKTLFEGMTRLRVYGVRTSFRTAAGLTGQTFSIEGDKVTGRVWLFFRPDRHFAIAARLRGAPGQTDETLREARAMIDSLQLEGAP